MEVKNTPIVSFPKKIESSSSENVKVETKILPEQFGNKKGKEEITKEMFKNRIDGMNEFLEPTTTAVKFQFHEKLNEYYVQIVDSMTDEVLKEIPNKKFLDIYASMTELMGMIVDEKL
ncbi:flagellar protein FlaG [Planococcus sp. MERTA32b]|nr:flagellar protein FlaG [Planococcus sp. MER TA 32b]